MADDDDSDQEVPPDVNVPTLTLDDEDWPKPATGDIPGSDEEKDPPDGPPPVVPDFSVTVQTLRDAQDALLPSSEDAVTAYHTLKEATNQKKNWIFQQESPGDLGQYYQWNVASQGSQTINVQPLKEIADRTPDMVASLDNALLSIADVVRLTGDYAGYMNLAAQTYVRADKDCFLPPE